MEPTTTSIGGSIACSPRAITVLAVPRFPDMAIPPIPGSMAPSKRAVFIASCKTKQLELVRFKSQDFTFRRQCHIDEDNNKHT